MSKPPEDNPPLEGVIVGDCLEEMPRLPAGLADAVVTDPPYGLGFMGKGWDHAVPGAEFWSAALRVAKPGAHLVAFGGTRTFHRLACAIEDAGWELRDTLCWLYGSGFPKSHNGPWGGTALKPAWEPIILARKPLAGTVAANTRAHGCGGLNIDGCRIGVADADYRRNCSGDRGHNGTRAMVDRGSTDIRAGGGSASNDGRWPANLILDEAAGAMLDEQAGERSFNTAGVFAEGQPAGWSGGGNNIGRKGPGTRAVFGYGDTGGASRFFYCPKASKADRDEGLAIGEAEYEHSGPRGHRLNGDGTPRPRPRPRPRQNLHPTVKPTALMRWLCRLVTPPGGLILDPFTGSGSTGKAAALEGFRFLGVELEDDYAQIARARIAHAAARAARPPSTERHKPRRADAGSRPLRLAPGELGLFPAQ